MIRPMKSRLLLPVVIAVLIPSVGSGVGVRRGMTEKDLFSFVWIADPQISPDGSQVAFVRVTRRREEGLVRHGPLDREDRRQRAAARAHERRPRDTSPALVARRPTAGLRPIGREGRARPSRRRSTSCRCRRRESRGPSPTSRAARAMPDWAPDGKTIAFSVNWATARRTAAKTGDKPAGDKPRESDVRVITEAVYRANGVPGAGFVDRNRPAHIWTVAVPATATDEADARDSGRRPASSPRDNYRWSPDGSRIFFTSDRRARPATTFPTTATSTRSRRRRRADACGQHRRADRRVCAVARRQARRVRRHARRQPRASYSQPDLWVADARNGHAAQPDRQLRLRHRRRDRRRPARAARPAPSGPVWSRGRPHDLHRRRRTGQRQPQAGRCRDRARSTR